MKDNGSEIMEAASSDFFSCEKCDSTFVTSRSLDSHVKAFHPLPKVSLTPKRVFEPEMRHSNECEKVTIKTDEPGIEDISRKVKIHPCRLCNRDFTSKDKLTDHHNMVHSEVTITVTKPTRTSKMPKPRVSLLKRPLDSSNGAEEQQRKKRVLNKSATNLTPLYQRLKSDGNFEITEVVRTLLISHMKAESGREVELVGGNAGKAHNSTPLSITMPFTNNVSTPTSPVENESEDEDEFEGEGSDEIPFEEIDPLLPLVTIEDGGEGIYRCSECGASCNTVYQLERHMEYHNSTNRPYKCTICRDSRGFVRKEHLTKHMSSVHSGMKFTCEFCGKDISRRDHLVRHIRTVHRCPIPPGVDFSTNIQFNENSATASQSELDEISDKALQSMQPKPKKPYTKCDMCDETFTHLETLFQHQRDAHSDIRKYNCDMCSKSFKRREHLQKHIVLHTGEKKFTCEHCAKSFPRRDALQDHLRRIHGTVNSVDAEEFSCNLCDKVFLQHSNLVRHRNQVHHITLAVAIANGSITDSSQDYSSRDGSDGPVVNFGKVKRPPLPELLPIQNFHFQMAPVSNF